MGKGVALDVRTHEPWRVALGLSLGALAGLAPVDSGLFIAAAGLVLLTGASELVALAALVAFKVLGVAVSAQVVEVGRSLDAEPSSTQRFLYGMPIVGLLGLERFAVAGALVLGAAASVVLAPAAFFIQKKVLAAHEAACRKAQRKKRDEWTPNVRPRFRTVVWESLPAMRRWVVLGLVVLAVEVAGSNAAAKWLLEDEVPALVARELGATGAVHVGEVSASILGARLRARNVTLTSEHASLTLPEIDVKLDFIQLLRRRFVAKSLRVHGGRVVLDRSLVPAPSGGVVPDANDELASRPRWTIWHAELEDVTVELRDRSAPLVARVDGELTEIAPDHRSPYQAAEVHLKGTLLEKARPTERFTLDVTADEGSPWHVAGTLDDKPALDASGSGFASLVALLAPRAVAAATQK